jgi:hypothetical protein
MSTELSFSWETASCAATQEFPNILWKPNIQYRAYKSPSQVPVLRQRRKHELFGENRTTEYVI